MNIISTRFGYGVLITPTNIHQITGLDTQAALREHWYLRTKNGYYTDDVSLEQFCEHFQLDVLDVQEFLEHISHSHLDFEDSEEWLLDLFEEEEDEFDRKIKAIELDSKYNLATIKAKDDMGRH